MGIHKSPRSPRPNRQTIHKCDKAMQAVFETDRVHMFTMNNMLSGHVQPRDEF
ncbi:hypothetical protein K469DRAFT_166390 [Zopfia rhizophila CBS 207.26]|uniref:DM2 domain-containing protein n=1 Tax=Zopfia rhizophila CBS 207.26 TaxID=1314779 RepID=A0A6A6E0M9_9PEZI|nr:hypothetical protein K469DRAFT_166390 [Zopfia rhizophila CBS 207.26]